MRNKESRFPIPDISQLINSRVTLLKKKNQSFSNLQIPRKQSYSDWMINLELGEEGSLAHLDTLDKLGVGISKDVVVVIANYEIETGEELPLLSFAFHCDLLDPGITRIPPTQLDGVAGKVTNSILYLFFE